MTCRACRCACGKESAGRGFARIIAARRKSPRSRHSPHADRFARAICRDCGETVRAGLSARPHAQSLRCVQSRFQARHVAAMGQGARRGLRRHRPLRPHRFADGHTERMWRFCAAPTEAKTSPIFCSRLSQEHLAHTLFPLGEMQKNEVREKARRLGFAGGGTSRESGYLLRRLQGSGGDLRGRERARRRRCRRPRG